MIYIYEQIMNKLKKIDRNNLQQLRVAKLNENF